MVYHSVCDVSKSKKQSMHALCTHLIGPSALNQKGEGGRFPLNLKRCLFMRGNLVSNPNQVLFSLELVAWGIGLILKVLLNPTSGRDASHPCLISTWPKEECTIVCVMWEEQIFPQSGIVCFGNGPRSRCHSRRLLPLLSLPDVRLSKFVRVRAKVNPTHPKVNNT